MARSLTFSTDSQSPKTALIVSVANPSPARNPLSATLGETWAASIYLACASDPIAGTAGANGWGYDPASGSGALTLTLGVGQPGGVPSGGSYTLSFGGYTAVLAYNSDAADIQAALQGLASIGVNNVAVFGQFPEFDVQFMNALGNAPQLLLTANAGPLTPRSAVVVAREQAGSASPAQNEIQSLDIFLQPVVLQSTWAPITASIPAGNPAGGTYTLSFAGFTTAPISFNATARDVQSALWALPSIQSGNVAITGQFPAFNVQFVGALAGGPMPLITGSGSGLAGTGSGLVSVASVVNGSASQNAVQSVGLEMVTAQPIGWVGEIDFNTAGLSEMFSVSGQPPSASITTAMEISTVDYGGNPTVWASPAITIFNRVVNHGGSMPFLGNYFLGTFNIPSGADSGTVTGLNLPPSPANISILGISKPAGGFNIFSMPVSGTLTTDGFSFELDAATPTTGYVLSYLITYTAPNTVNDRTFLGTVSLGLGVDSGTVIGLALPFAPSNVGILGISKPADGYNIFAMQVAGTLTTDGFSFELDAATPTTGYVLSYLIT